MDAWREFYRLYPFDDFHRYYRPAALVSSVQARDTSAAIRNSLEWLQPAPITFCDADMRSLSAFGLTPPGR